jgi:RNA polymerase sigma factor (sigma-70 family)
LYGINRFLWKNELRKQRRNPELEWKDTLILSADDLDYSEEREEKIKLLDKVLNKVTERCKKIFELFYYKKENMQDIAVKLNFSSINSAKTQKYKCMESAIAMARELQTHDYQVRNEK